MSKSAITIGDRITYRSAGVTYSAKVLAIGSKNGAPTYWVMRKGAEIEIMASLVS